MLKVMLKGLLAQRARLVLTAVAVLIGWGRMRGATGWPGCCPQVGWRQ